MREREGKKAERKKEREHTHHTEGGRGEGPMMRLNLVDSTRDAYSPEGMDSPTFVSIICSCQSNKLSQFLLNLLTSADINHTFLSFLDFLDKIISLQTRKIYA